jgi:hypothetical protein
MESDHKTSQEDVPALSPSQRLAIEVLLSGGTDGEAAKAASIARETVCRWRHGDADFIAALNGGRVAVEEAMRDSLRRASLKAIETLSDLLADKSRPVRLKAADILLRASAATVGTVGDTSPAEIRTRWNAAHNRRANTIFG